MSEDFSINTAFEYLVKNRYNPKDFMDSEALKINEETTGVNQETRMKLFSEKTTEEEKYGILSMIINTQYNLGLLHRLVSYGRIKVKRIRVPCAWSSRRLLYIAHSDQDHCADTFARLPAELIVLIDHFLLHC